MRNRFLKLKTVLVLINIQLFIIGSILSNPDTLGFVSPVDHAIRLTGNFMELRPNHFHAGIDIKSTKGVVGDVIRSIQDGYISRIKVQSGGYGNALYITHPNGYTSVYAHLHNYMPEVEAFIKAAQYHIESFEVDIYLPDSLFLLKRSDEIGRMGNSGRSFGPHLHFEIRETDSEAPVNPELLGIGPEDDIAPSLESLHLYILGEGGDVADKQVRYFNPKAATYQLYKEVVEIEGSRVGLGLQMYDQMNGAWNKNGIYSYEVEVDGETVFSWRADAFSFSETRLINAFWDYERKYNHGQKVYLLYKSACNPFPYYKGQTDGIIDIDSKRIRQVRINVGDLHGNMAELGFGLKGKDKEVATGVAIGKPSGRAEGAVLMMCDTSTTIRKGYFKVDFNDHNFYTPLDLEFRYHQEIIEGQKCPSITVGRPSIPIHGYYTISCPVPKGYTKQWVLASKNSSGRLIHFGGDTIQGRFVAKVDQLGSFYLFQDLQAPMIEPISFSKEMRTPWKLKISDNLREDGRADELSYRATIDGQWVRMLYDKKNSLLICNDKDKLKANSKSFKLEVWDHSGNNKVYTRRL